MNTFFSFSVSFCLGRAAPQLLKLGGAAGAACWFAAAAVAAVVAAVLWSAAAAAEWCLAAAEWCLAAAYAAGLWSAAAAWGVAAAADQPFVHPPFLKFLFLFPFVFRPRCPPTP